jgi:hypothetical protein
MSETTPAVGEAAHESPEARKQDVTVELDGKPRVLKKGKYTGRTLKLVLGVPIEHELEEVIGREFKPIANDAEIHIKGGEKFVSHVGQGQAS